MNNRDTQETWKYDDGTKHSYWSIRNNPHFLDWANRPQPFKIYPKIEPLPLPRDLPHTGVAALSAISEPVPPSRADSVPDLQDLARILYFSAGITKQRAHPGGEIYFRAAACTGALYEIELYVVTGDLAGLDAGVYHFNPADVSLRLLRKGDFRRNLAQATAMEPSVAHAPATIICTGTYWRNAWKYQARTYRHFGWDNGTLVANMLAVSAASGLPAEIVLGFVDGEVNRLLDLDTRREVSLCLVPVGRASESSLPALREALALGLETIPLSEREVGYPAMLEMHDASSLESEEEVTQWRGKQQVFPSSAPAGEAVRFQRLPEEEQPKDTIEQVILRRGSTRAFDKTASITLEQLSTIVDCATRGLPADFLEPPRRAAQRSLPNRACGAGAQAGCLLLPAGAEHPGAFEGWGIPRRGSPSWTGAGAAGGRLCGHLLSRRFETHPRRIREPRLPSRPARGGRNRRENVSGCVCPGPGCNRADLLRR
jgi:SagB-type dehydrogenase family enzyme